MAALFADVLLPLPLIDRFTYSIPACIPEEVRPGKRVTVPFGTRKIYAALVLNLHSDKPSGYQVKEILSVIDDEEVVLPGQLKLWQWIADYYCCPLGEVMRAALPSAMKLESHTKFRIAGKEASHDLNPEEKQLLATIKGKPITLSEVQKHSGKLFSFRGLKSLLEKGTVEIIEELGPGFKPKTSEMVSLNPEINSENEINRILAGLSRSPKQKSLLEHFLKKSGFPGTKCPWSLPRASLLKGTTFTGAGLNGLVKKNILEISVVTVSRIDEEPIEQTSLNILSEGQFSAFEKVRSLFTEKPVVLLHGITASGKTEIYIHLIDEIVKQGKQALYLVPEIVLTAQIVRRLKNAFGSKVGVYHSKMNDQERVEIWNKVLGFRDNPAGSYQVILGARSAVFLPFSNLGLVIADEEHENSYKQYDPAPRYHARDVSIVLATDFQARVLLGSATPSYESYLNVLSSKYGLVEMTRRYSEVELPEIVVADLQDAYKRKQMKSVFTPALLDKMAESLDCSEQVILFQNRRGYSPFIECMECGWIPICRSCDVSLTYHKQKNKLTCHYCGYSADYPDQCPRCSSKEVKSRGFGTEKIEAEVKRYFKNARVARMDLDTTQAKNAFEKLIRNLETKKTDVLIGTQMVTKGLDFDNVNLVGILNADNLINFPDFRAHERAFQLLSQVSGRAGRRRKKGTVIIQTTHPGHPVIEAIRNQSFRPFLLNQLAERKMFNYPPYSRLVRISVKHKNQEKGKRAARQLAEILRNESGFTVLGPEPPLVSRIQTWFLMEIWIKLPRSVRIPQQKKFIRDSAEAVRHLPDNSGTQVNIDVDPM